MKREILTGIVTAISISIIYALWERLIKIPTDFQIPKGAVMAFNKSSCPSGWIELYEARGRYIVGLNKGGTLAEIVGDGLADQESRPTGEHSHPFEDHLLLHPNGIRSHGGSATDTGNHIATEWRQGSGVRQTLLKSNSGKAGKPETNAPYIQLLICEKQ